MRCARVAWLGLTLVACGAPYERRLDVAYDERFGASTTLDAFLPRSAELLPAVVVVHGGAWETESKERFHYFSDRLAAEGYANFSINYRLTQEGGGFPNAPRDVHCALSWVHQHAVELGVDARRIAMFGYSAGAHLSALVAVSGDRKDLAPDCGLAAAPPPRAVISGAGPMDLTALGWAWQVRNFLGGAPEEIPDVYRRASPLEQVGEGEPPFLFIHGDGDLYVPLSHSERMHAALRAHGNASELLVLRGGGHVVNPSASSGTIDWVEWVTDSPEGWAAIVDFLRRELAP